MKVIRLLPVVLLLSATSAFGHYDHARYYQLVKEVKSLNRATVRFVRMAKMQAGDHPVTWEALRLRRHTRTFRSSFRRLGFGHRFRLMVDIRSDFRHLRRQFNRLNRTMKRSHDVHHKPALRQRFENLRFRLRQVAFTLYGTARQRRHHHYSTY